MRIVGGFQRVLVTTGCPRLCGGAALTVKVKECAVPVLVRGGHGGVVRE